VTTVAVLGGGVGGLSAAHELAERGFDVTVYEARAEFGGKARSMPVPGSGTGGRADLPAEHGFRFFPGFYRHLPDTMSRTPHGGRSVADRLVPATRILLAQAGGRDELIAAAGVPASLDDVGVAVRFLWKAGTQLGIPPQEIAEAAERLITLLTSCDERRLEQWEKLSWWVYTDAEHRSPAFQKFFADGLTRTLVAARAREISARTGGLILAQIIFDLTRIGGRADRVLDAPTSEAWIDPWLAHLRGLGVTLRGGCEVAGIDCKEGRIAGATVQTTAGTEPVAADHYVAALPVERLRLLLSPELRAAEPRLTLLPRLVVRWMNGVMFYLDRDVPLQRGHAIFIDSEWALTAISQAQFWPDVDLGQRGDGRVEGILSVDVSEWERPGRRTGKVAMACTPEEIRAEVWGQLTDHIDDGSLREENVVAWFLDPAIRFPNPTAATNLEPLLVNTAGSWEDRPDAATRIPNLFLAADFVRTHTDLATMEGANEAARRAVNGILDASGSAAARCKVWKLREPPLLAPFRALDRVRWRLGRPPAKPPLRVTPDGAVEATGPVARGLMAVGRRVT
jgi:uncharacterized protein with NAD-binding domain and iron-sulfur cluster